MGGARLLSSLHVCVLSLLGCVLVVAWREDDQRYSTITSPEQELYMEPSLEIKDSDFIHHPPPPPSSITPPYLLLPMFHHQSSPAVSKELLSPVTESRMMPSSLSEILIPHKRQTHIRVTPVNNNHGVEVWCGYSKITVRINLALLNFRSSAADFGLGTCPASRAVGSVLYFRYNLNECGSSISVINGQLLYLNEVLYKPERQESVIRAVPLALPIQCEYDRFHYSYKIGYLPELRLRSFRKTLSRKQVFSLSLRNEKWEELRENITYVLGDSVYFEAGVDVMAKDERVYVEACHVTASEDSNSTQRYDVISNFGCMADSMRTGSRSRFVSRQMNILRFSLDAFSFAADESQRFYLHCTVAVGKRSVSIAAKSCTYRKSERRWEELHGDAAVCDCCDSECLPPGFNSASRIEQVLVSSKSWGFNHQVSSETSQEFLNTLPGFIMFHHHHPDPEREELFKEEEEELLEGEEFEEEVLVGVSEMSNDKVMSDEGMVEGKKDGDEEKEESDDDVQKEKKTVQKNTRRNRWRSSLKEPGKTKSI